MLGEIARRNGGLGNKSEVMDIYAHQMCVQWPYV